MLGSIIGDIVGSIYEFDNIKTKEFPLFSKEAEYTDDSILTIATADWLLHGGEVAEYYLKYATEYPYPMGAYGSSFMAWVSRSKKGQQFEPYNSCGNGSAMRVGPVGWAFDTKEEVLDAAKKSAECTHNHPEGIKGAQATALCIFMARKGATKEEIRNTIEKEFGYDLQFTCDGIRDSYGWGDTCQTSVPQAIVAFLDGNDFEDCIRNAISIGGDSDTIGCITGSIAEAFYGIPADIYDKAMEYLPQAFKDIVREFEERYAS
ncbi:MAG: ADP-ribosylglycohydrolase family protein [Prevotella sp.]|nr:ADP-ribosylglycohydrolase family protein [Prevotella sp.]